MTGAPSRVALVTGASGGIGSALAEGLAADGLQVGLVARDEQRLAATLERVRATGGQGAVAVADVTDAGQVRRAVAAVEAALGPVDLLVNNAGRIEATEVPPWEADPEDWWAVVEANLRGPFLLAHAVLPGMVARRRGRVVDLSSGFGVRDSPTYSAYAASKAALFRLSGALALAGAERGVTAFEVAPGVVRTPMTAGMPMWQDAPEQRFTPAQRVVDLVVAIAAGRLDALTGRYLRADRDDVPTLIANAERIVAADARTLRIRPWGSDDPLG